MTAALLLEQLMTHPRYGELVDHLRATANPAHVAQVDAATADAIALMTGLGRDVLGVDHATPTTVDQTPGWLRLGLLDTFTAWAEGQAVTCLHQPTVGRPLPVLAAAWRPRMVVCGLCVHLVALPRGSAADRTCDACGHRCAGVEHGDGIYPGMVQFGPVIYQYGVCSDCRPPITTGTGPLRATHSQDPGTPRGAGRVRPRGRRGRGRGRGRR
ncbi:hypothetical protein [Verrucosispora sp. WMMD1129]|uniref:hypothetical protein n=1 Tax=Verrucosispora sp. WMMD1129 TaxID=3016093 RepID=UPI00249A0B4E|nr:hypothetical protein [Verrucosispora sp. WMMD1129]WFE46281.1 hypothetical protein O7624_18985 [Verrucosispora sp. WMMD1129]